MITDEIIIQTCFQANSSCLKRKFDFDKLDKDIQEYLLNRFNDSLSIFETLKRIYHHVYIHPKCPICGKPVKNWSLGPEMERFYFKTCGSKKCVYEFYHKNFVKKYGVTNPIYLPNAIENLQHTLLERYGVTTPLKNKEIKQRQEQKCLELYGVKNVAYTDWCHEKSKETWLKNYGVDHPMKCEQILEKFNWEKMIEKQQETKRRNNSFHKSKPEDDSYDLLCNIFGKENIIRHHKTKLYPFACDLYIIPEDLYIECNYHWTHGEHPFNENNEDDIKLRDEWLKRKKKYYNNAVTTWSIRDVKKRNIAKESKINYLEFFTFNEFKNYIIMNYDTGTGES